MAEENQQEDIGTLLALLDALILEAESATVLTEAEEATRQRTLKAFQKARADLSKLLED